MQIDSSALDALRDEPGGLIVAANHPTMLDALLVVARLPRGVCVMKAELMRNVFLGGGARLAQLHPQRRRPRHGARRRRRRCARATSSCCFRKARARSPRRSTRSSPGITLIAHLAQVPIQTVDHRERLALSHQGLAAAEGAAGAGADPPAARPALRARCRSSRPAAPARAATSPRSCGGERDRVVGDASGPHPELRHRRARLRDGARRARAPGRRCGSSSTAAATARPKACARWPPPTPGCASTCSRATSARAPPCCTRSRRRARPASRTR